MPFCSLCGNTEPGDLGATIGICLNAEACHRRQAERREYRTYVAEMIARAIEDSVCEPGEQCAGRFCPDCVKHAQAKADAALARKMATR